MILYEKNCKKEVKIIKRNFALAVKAVIIKDTKFLLLHRSKKEIENSYMNRRQVWDLPGGGVRFFETAKDGLIREITEETGLKVTILKPLCTFDAIKPQMHLSIFTYLCEYKSGEVYLSSEHDKFYWLTLDDMNCMDIPNWMKQNFELAIREWKKGRFEY